MKELKINLGANSYPIYITSDYGRFGECLKKSGLSGKLAIITDSNVAKHQLVEFDSSLRDEGINADIFVISAGEKSKNLDTVRDIYDFLVNMKLDRNSGIIALGGGVVGDIAGFAAATFMRGINFIQVPTSMLAQADSSVGGKVGVDFRGAKNLIGAFYQPRLVYINVNSLKTLPRREMLAGLAEIIKHGIISDAEFFEYIEKNTAKILEYDPEALQYLAEKNCGIKGRVVEQDEKEKDLRAILNFGHTFGHAIESVSGFSLLHGECVSIGMAAAFRLAEKMGFVSGNTVERVEKLLAEVGLPVRCSGLKSDDIVDQLYMDKKVKNGRLLFILPRRIGEVFQIVIDDTSLIRSVIEEISLN